MVIQISEQKFGESQDPFDNNLEKLYTFKNSHNVEVQVMNYGATIVSIKLPTPEGDSTDIVLGYDTVSGFKQSENPYFGATVGRVCNRTKNAEFNLNGRRYELSRNLQGSHHIHGGFIGMDKVIWHSSIRNNTVLMTHCSPDNHEGYPGELNAKVIFELTEDNSFMINYTADCMIPTIVNLTNHAYFNLAGHKTGVEGLMEHSFYINALYITETDKDSFPTGNLQHVADSPYDFRQIKPIAHQFGQLLKDGAKGYDDNYCLNMNDNTKECAARVYHEKSKRWMEVFSNQPGLQFYTSNYFPDKIKNEKPILGKQGAEYYKHAGFCLESQKYPDSVHHDNFPSIVLPPGDTYNHFITYKFGFEN